MFRVTDTRALGYRLSAQRDVAEQLSPARWAVDGARRCEAPILIEWSGGTTVIGLWGSDRCWLTNGSTVGAVRRVWRGGLPLGAFDR